MSANRLFILLGVIALIAVVAFTAQQVFSKSNPIYNESKEQIQREAELGEHYGELLKASNPFSAEQLQREYQLGERYGVTPQENSEQQALREYWLGERYGQIP